MTDTLVLSAAYTTDSDRWRIFRESCARNDVPVHMFGTNGEDFPDMDGLKLAADFLATRSERYIVLTDAYDVVVNRWDARELRYAIDSAPHCIMSVEPLVWPAGPWEVNYAPLATYHWKAICGGQYCGRREQMITLLNEIHSRWMAGAAQAGGTSQEILHHLFAGTPWGQSSIRWPFTLDLSCRIFQSMLGEPAKHIYLDRGLARNDITKSAPMFLHFNGQGQDLTAYREFAQRMGY